MFEFAVCEIAGKQIKVLPNQPFAVTLSEGQSPEVKVLLLVEGGKVKIGKPYLKEDLKLKLIEQIKGPKIHVFKFHAKANFRKHTGFRSKLTKIVAVA